MPPVRNRLQKSTLKEAPTLQDVAARAGVSAATVSRCLNLPDAVRPALRHRVDAAIAELGYVVHGPARALKTQRSHTVGAVIPTIDNAIFARAIQALQDRLYQAGYTLLLASTSYDPAQELDQVRSLVERGLDALMLIGEAHAEALYELLVRTGVPYVNAWTFRPDGEHPCVGFDNRAVARRLANYVIDMGHRDIAMIAGATVGNDRAADRLAGVRDALGERGLDFGPGRLLERPYSIGDGRAALRHLMALTPRPTAVICGNDILAFGALFGCHELGIAVPDEVSITGFDDLELAAEMVPALTTVHVPSELMGRLTAEYLLARLAGETVPHATKLDANLIVRASTAPPRRA